MADEQAQVGSTEQSPLDAELIAYGDKLYKDLSRTRHVEELNWYETALMYNRQQWLTKEGSGASARWKPIQQDINKPKPMPVSNYLGDTVDTLANALGARIPPMIAQPNDDSDDNRAAADYAQHACEEIDRETKMDIQNPIMAKHICLFGTGVTKDSVDNTQGSKPMPEVGTEEQMTSQCADCGAVVEPGAVVCPDCGSPNIEQFPTMMPMVGNVYDAPTNNLKTEVKLIFSVYVPRKCVDANISPVVLERFRVPLDEAKEDWKGVDFQPDSASANQAQFYEEALQSLGGFTGSSGNGNENVTFTEVWSDYKQLPKKLKDALQSDQSIDLQVAIKDGIMWIYAGGKVVEKKANPFNGKKPYTFYQWGKDAANPYPKAPADDIKPLQKQLNRLDSLTERYLMVGGGQWLVPKTQQGSFIPTGDPVDIRYYDTIGDGKVKPEFIPAVALGSWVAQKRQSIIADIERIGRTQGVIGGNAPAGVKSFRGVAYLGQKADEQLDTPRFLYEQGHKLRKEKVLLMAQKYWNEPRKVRVAGFNGRSSAKMLDGSMLEGDYDLDWIEGSSRKKTLDEEMQSFQVLLEAGMVNVTDSQTRDFVFDRLDLEGVNMADHLQYQKAQRDLDLLKQGQQPPENPFIKWDIPLLIFSQFCQTEEFEALDPQIQDFIIQYCQYVSDKLTAIKMNSMPADGSGDPNAIAAQAFGQLGAGQNPLGAAPGKDSTGSIEKAAKSEGQNVEKQVSAH